MSLENSQRLTAAAEICPASQAVPNEPLHKRPFMEQPVQPGMLSFWRRGMPPDRYREVPSEHHGTVNANDSWCRICNQSEEELTAESACCRRLSALSPGAAEEEATGGYALLRPATLQLIRHQFRAAASSRIPPEPCYAALVVNAVRRQRALNHNVAARHVACRARAVERPAAAAAAPLKDTPRRYTMPRTAKCATR